MNFRFQVFERLRGSHYFQLPIDEAVEAVLLRATDSDLNDSVPPEAVWPTVQT